LRPVEIGLLDLKVGADAEEKPSGRYCERRDALALHHAFDQQRA